MLRRQWGVPAFSNNPALATRGTTHCTKSANVTSLGFPRGSDSDIAAYVATSNSHRDRNIHSERDEDMLVLEFQSRREARACCAGLVPTYLKDN
jgi:hypothetical protein